MLDLFANRCLAQGTNAWTDTDHTCYTMTTAGSEGFLNLLPIYLDHVLYPTLTVSPLHRRYLGDCQTCMMDAFAQIVDGFYFCLKLVSAIFYQIFIFHQMIAL